MGRLLIDESKLQRSRLSTNSFTGKSMNESELLNTTRMPSNPHDNLVLAPSLQIPPQTVEAATAEKHTYGQILKSSALIGGSSVVNIAIGIVRTKAMALLLGPAGFGLMGVYGSIANLAQSIAGMGINSSGVRQIAEAVGSGETERIARTAVVLRRTSVILGIVGRCFTGRVFQTGVHLDFWRRSTRRCRGAAVSRCVLQFSVRRSGGIDPGNAANR